MKDIIKLLRTLKEKIDNHTDKFRSNEGLTRYALIDPILRHLGWDLSNPAEIIPEFNINNMRCDYAVFKNNKPQPFAIIETKKLKAQLIDKKQLGSYIGNSTARFGIYTDGVKWKVMDFWITKIDDPDERIVMDCDILSEQENTVALKIFSISKENIFSENPYFIHSPKISPPKQQSKTLPTEYKPEKKVTPNMFEHEKDSIFHLKTDLSIKIDVQKSDIKKQLEENGLFCNDVNNFSYKLKTKCGLLPKQKH